MSWSRPWRRRVKAIGTMGGNKSVTDEVLAAGPPVDLSPGGALGAPDFGLYRAEGEAAVESDLQTDTASDFSDEADAENKMWDELGRSDPPGS